MKKQLTEEGLRKTSPTEEKTFVPTRYACIGTAESNKVLIIVLKKIGPNAVLSEESFRYAIRSFRKTGGTTPFVGGVFEMQATEDDTVKPGTCRFIEEYGDEIARTSWKISERAREVERRYRKQIEVGRRFSEADLAGLEPFRRAWRASRTGAEMRAVELIVLDALRKHRPGS